MEQSFQNLQNYDLRKLQLVETEMLKDLKEICERNNIRYYISSGTLLGAVRHKGFIPWDNDIDVQMPCDDYERFVKLTEKEIGPKYFIQSYETEKNYYRAYARLRLNNSMMMYPWESMYKTHHGIWLDVFPLVETNSVPEWRFKKLLVRVANVLGMQDCVEANREEWLVEKGKTAVKFLELLFRLTSKKFREKLRHRMLRFIKKSRNKDCVSILWLSLAKRMPKSYFSGEPAQVLFEGELYPAPKKYHEYLTLLYGDYMTPPPEKDRATHDGLMVDMENDYTKYMKAF